MATCAQTGRARRRCRRAERQGSVFEIKTGIGRPAFWGAAKKKRAEISDVEGEGEKTEKQKKDMLSSRPRSA